MTDPRRILVVTPAWVGDVVMSHTIFQVLAERFPQARLDALSPVAMHAVLRRMPEVSECLSLPQAHGQLKLMDQWRMGRRLRERRYDSAIVVRGSVKAAVLPWLARIPVRVGARGEYRPFLLTREITWDLTRHPTTIARYAALAMADIDQATHEGVPWPQLVFDRKKGRAGLLELGVGAPGVRRIGLAPGAAQGPAKRWPVEHWRSLARDLISAGDQVLVFGGPDEREDGDAVALDLDGVVNLCGRTSLDEAIDMISTCDGFVSNDSGLMHVAAATDVPVLGLYGPTSPRDTPPLSRHARTLWLELECAPCGARECPLGHHRCLRDLTPDRVRTSLEGIAP